MIPSLLLSRRRRAFNPAATFAPLAGATFTGPLVLQGSTTLAEGANVVLGTATGTKIGTAVTQKLGFFNATPVVQRAGAAQAAAAATAAVNVTPFGFTTGAQADAIVTLVNEIRATLVQLGLMKGSA